MYYKAEIFDKLQYMYEETGFNDHQLHCVIEFHDKVDEKILKQALFMCIRKIPILGTTYYHNNGNGFWADSKKWEKAFVQVNTKEEFLKFSLSKVNELTAPQVRMFLFQGEKDKVSVIMNHMICDASDFKKFLYLLADTYSSICDNSNYISNNIWNESRDYISIISELSFITKMKCILMKNKESNQKSNIKFPFSNSEKVFPIIETIDLDNKDFYRIKQYAAENKVTVNDIIMGVYSKVLIEFLELDDVKMNLPIMIDMRKYGTKIKKNNLANLSSMVIVNFRALKNDTCNELIRKINKAMIKNKSQNMGMNGLLKLKVISQLFGEEKSYKTIKDKLINPEVFMTNIGIIDQNKMVFKGADIKRVYMTGSIKYRPYFQIAVSSFNEVMTLSSNLYGDETDQKNIRKILEMLKTELKRLQSQF